MGTGSGRAVTIKLVSFLRLGYGLIYRLVFISSFTSHEWDMVGFLAMSRNGRHQRYSLLSMSAFPENQCYLPMVWILSDDGHVD